MSGTQQEPREQRKADNMEAFSSHFPTLLIAVIILVPYCHKPELDNILHWKDYAVRFDQSPDPQELRPYSHILAPNAPFKKYNNKLKLHQSQTENQWNLNAKGLNYLTISLRHCRGILSCVVSSTAELSYNRKTVSWIGQSLLMSL